MLQMFARKPPFDLTAFLSEKADPAEIKRAKQFRAWKTGVAAKSTPTVADDAKGE